MVAELQVGLNRLQYKLIRFCVDNGTLPLFQRGLQDARIGFVEDLFQKYVEFVSSMQYVGNAPRQLIQEYRSRYNGGNVQFYTAHGLVMAIYRRRPVDFFPAIKLTGSETRPVQSVERPPATVDYKGVTIPREGHIFRAALATQLPAEVDLSQ